MHPNIHFFFKRGLPKKKKFCDILYDLLAVNYERNSVEFLKD